VYSYGIVGRNQGGFCFLKTSAEQVQQSTVFIQPAALKRLHVLSVRLLAYKNLHLRILYH
jgi:hypothetical protein